MKECKVEWNKRKNANWIKAYFFGLSTWDSSLYFFMAYLFVMKEGNLNRNGGPLEVYFGTSNFIPSSFEICSGLNVICLS